MSWVGEQDRLAIDRHREFRRTSGGAAEYDNLPTRYVFVGAYPGTSWAPRISHPYRKATNQGHQCTS